MEPFQIHAIVQVIGLLGLVAGVYYAKNHYLRIHHALIYSATASLTLGVGYMLYTARGVPSTHGKLGLLVYLYVLFTILGGRAFLARKITRAQHQRLGITAVLSLALQILLGVYVFLF